jgi:hypothetical protein
MRQRKKSHKPAKAFRLCIIVMSTAKKRPLPPFERSEEKCHVIILKYQEVA